MDKGYAVFRVRHLPTPELSQAITADVMSDFLPNLRKVSGYLGYVFAFDVDDSAAQLTLELTADEIGAAGYTSVSKDFVAALDPRFSPRILNQTNGPVAALAVTSRTASQLPPNLAGCSIAMRYRQNAPGIDVEHVISLIRDGLTPTFAHMPGFIMYALIRTENGLAGVNIWETATDMAAGDKKVAEWAGTNTLGTWTGEVTVHEGTIYFAELAGLNKR